jgi:zinc protease
MKQLRSNRRMRKSIPLIIVIAMAAVAFFYWGKNQPARNSAEHPTVKESATVAEATAKPWPHSASDIAADTKAVFGSLPNGMRYMIYPNTEPPKRVSLRMHIATGALMEQDDQQGVAHFLEHMVFNGSKNFTPDELVPRMQRLGIGFGAHVNAYTSFDETVYMLDLPDLSDEIVKLGYTVMRDFGDGALLKAEEIDKERGVIISEKISRDSVSQRMMMKQFSQLLPDSLIPKRFPIGTEEVIKTAPRQRFVDYYSQYYTPTRMTFIVVGDIDPKVTEAKIKEVFSSMKNPATPGSNPDLGKVEELKGMQPAVFTDKELSGTDVSLIQLHAYENKPDTSANRAERMPLSIAHGMLNRRFERMAKEENAVILSGGASRSVLFNFAEIGSIEVGAKDDDWKKALPVLDQEFRRALEFGFNEAELAEAKANILNAYQQAVKSAASRKSDALASGIAKSINDDSVFSTPQTDLELATKALEKIDIAACQKAFVDFWKSDSYHLVLSTKSAPDSAKDELLAIYQESQKTKVSAPEARNKAAFAYTEMGPEGSIAKRNEIADLGITQLTLSNGIRVNLKSTDFTKNTISMMARFGGGQLTMPKDKPGLTIYAGAAYNGGGLGKHSADELQEILAGKNVGTELGIDEDAFILAGKTTPDDLELQFQLFCASLTDPGYRDDAIRQFKAALPMIEQQLKHSPAGPKAEIEGWMHGDDMRFMMPPVSTLGAYTVDDVKAWLTPALTTASMELSIVGDFSIETMIPLLLKTVGSLPKRDAAPVDIADLRKVTMPTTPAKKDTTYDSKVPQAIALVSWKTTGLRNNQKESRRLNVVASILSDRLREEIREKLGASYSPNAGFDGSQALENFGYISAMSVGKPEDLKKLSDTILMIGNKLGSEGATADELDRSLKPTIASIEKTLRDNNYWLQTVLSSCQEKPEVLDLARDRSKDYASITLEEINALAKKYLVNEGTFSVTIQSSEEK